MVEAPLAGQDVHEPEVDVVHGHGAGDRLELPQAPHFAEPPARVGLLHQHLERQATRRAPVAAPPPPPPGEVERLLPPAHPPPPPPRPPGPPPDGGLPARP